MSRYLISVVSGRLSPERVHEDDIDADDLDAVGPETAASDGLTGLRAGERIVGEWHDEETGRLTAVLVDRDVRRDAWLRVRVTEEHRSALSRIAREGGATVSEVVRRLVADEVRRRPAG